MKSHHCRSDCSLTAITAVNVQFADLTSLQAIFKEDVFNTPTCRSDLGNFSLTDCSLQVLKINPKF